MLKVEAGGVLLIVNSDPAGTDIAEGFNVAVDAANQRRGAGPHKYAILSSFNIPDTIGKGYLMLRDPDDGKGHFGARRRLHDVAGPARFGKNTLAAVTEIKEPGEKDYWKTQVWPINGQNHGKPNDVYLQTERSFEMRTDKTWSRKGTSAGWRKDGGELIGYVGGVGYKRSVQGPGTPGYHNDIVKKYCREP